MKRRVSGNGGGREIANFQDAAGSSNADGKNEDKGHMINDIQCSVV